jgi:hypothetical protein
MAWQPISDTWRVLTSHCSTSFRAPYSNMAFSSNDKVPEPPLQDDTDPATSSTEPLQSTPALQENLPLRAGNPEHTNLRTAASQNSNPRPFLRSGSTTSAAFTSTETSHPSPRPSPESPSVTGTAMASAAAALAAPVQPTPDNHSADVEHSSSENLQVDLQEQLPSPGTIEMQKERVNTHRRSVSGESGSFGDRPDVSVPQHLVRSYGGLTFKSKPTNPKTPPKQITPLSESRPRETSDDYYEKEFGILLLSKGTSKFTALPIVRCLKVGFIHTKTSKKLDPTYEQVSRLA